MEMINRIFSIHDTTYTFVNNFTPLGAFSSITNSILVKLDPQGNLFESLFLNGENMIPPTTDSIVVTQKQCLIGLYTPNAFTPDHSGHNDVFRPVIMGNVSYFDFQVFNRWGQKVFETQTPGAGWDGNIGGLPSVADTYVWICRYSLSGQEMRTEKGSVVLIR